MPVRLRSPPAGPHARPLPYPRPLIHTFARRPPTHLTARQPPTHSMFVGSPIDHGNTSHELRLITSVPPAADGRQAGGGRSDGRRAADGRRAGGWANGQRVGGRAAGGQAAGGWTDGGRANGQADGLGRAYGRAACGRAWAVGRTDAGGRASERRRRHSAGRETHNDRLFRWVDPLLVAIAELLMVVRAAPSLVSPAD